MSKAETISKLINEWIEIYHGVDKRTAKAREIKQVVFELSILIGRGC